MDGASFTDVDAKVAAVQPPPTDAEIVAWLLETEDVSDYDNSVEVEYEIVECPDRI